MWWLLGKAVWQEFTQKSFSNFLWKPLLSHNLLSTILNANTWGGISPWWITPQIKLSALMCRHFRPVFGAGRVPCYVLNSRDQNFTCQRASSSANPWLQLPLRSWTSSSQRSSWRWGSVWKGSFCPTCEETPILHLHTCFSEHVSVMNEMPQPWCFIYELQIHSFSRRISWYS